jgi:hypothetical protein
VGDLELVAKVQFDSLLDYRRESVTAAVKVADPDHGHYKWISDDWGDHGHGNCNEGGW